MPHNLGKRKIATILLIIVFFLAIGLSIVSFFLYRSSQFQRSANKFTETVTQQISSLSSNNSLPKDMKKYLDIVNQQNLPKNQRYEALKALAFYFSNEYSTDHDPSVRAFSKDVLGKYAKENFPDLYNDTIFNFVCADPTCGQPIPSDIQTVLNMIDKSKSIPENVKITVSDNLTNAGYMTDPDERLFGLELSFKQLSRVGNQEASAAADVLRTYIKKEYKLSDKDLLQ